MTAKAKDYKRYYNGFNASISEKVDCGRFCAPLNGNVPVCCTSDNAIPIISKAEWKHLKKQTDIWKKFKPFDKTSRKIVKELHETCKAVDCSIAPICQREHRTLACRSFPFYPYFNKQEEIIGISYYWIFEDRCWILSNLKVVEVPFINEMLDTYEDLFTRDEEERQAFVDQSKDARKYFSKKNRPMPIITREGGLLKVVPKSKGQIEPATLEDFITLGPYTSQNAYEKAIRDADGDPAGCKL
jgi:hypothetical protein